MNYQQISSSLHDVFKHFDFEERLAKGEKHTVRHTIHTCTNGTEIEIWFPGYKTQASPFKPDYRVDIIKKGQDGIPLSHANIIVDIYNKCIAGNIDKQGLLDALIEQVCDCNVDYEQLAIRLPYNSISPSKDLLDIAQKAHNGKSYRRDGNAADLTIQELFNSIKWISIQEDFNYPMPRYQGRKMPYTRYIEAVYVAMDPYGNRTLSQVIDRALTRGRPPHRWPEKDALALIDKAMKLQF